MYWNVDDSYFHTFPCYGVMGFDPEGLKDHDICYLQFECKLNHHEVLANVFSKTDHTGSLYRLRIDQVLGLITEDLFDDARVMGFPDMRWFMEMQFGNLTWEFIPIGGLDTNNYQVSFFPEIAPDTLYIINTEIMREPCL